MQNPYSEDQLVEQPAIALLAEMGWETLDCQSEFDRGGGSPLGREHKSEVVLTMRLTRCFGETQPPMRPIWQSKKRWRELTHFPRGG